MKTQISPKNAVDELYPQIRNFVRRRVRQEQDQEDLVQDIFLKLKQSLSKIRNQDRLMPWLYRTATNQVIDYYRTHRAETNLQENAIRDVGTEDANTAAQEVATWLHYFIQNLKDEDREILELIEMKGLTQKAAAEKLGITSTAAKSRHQRAKRRLRKDLELCCRYYLDARGKIMAYQARADSDCECR